MKKHMFGVSGFEYYVAGRFSVLCGFPTAGNILHHAIEMFLKLALYGVITEDEMKHTFKHKIKLLWEEFKKHHPEASLTGYDQIINDLNRWEEIRYPTDDYKHLSTAINRPTISPPRKPGTQPKKYVLYLEEIDQLVSVIFQTAKIPVQQFKSVFIGVRAEPHKAKEVYDFMNVHKLPLDK